MACCGERFCIHDNNVWLAKMYLVLPVTGVNTHQQTSCVCCGPVPSYWTKTNSAGRLQHKSPFLTHSQEHLAFLLKQTFPYSLPAFTTWLDVSSVQSGNMFRPLTHDTWIKEVLLCVKFGEIRFSLNNSLKTINKTRRAFLDSINNLSAPFSLCLFF